MAKIEHDDFDVSGNSLIADDVIAEALERKLRSKSARPESLRKILNRARGAEAARRKKLDDFRVFLDDFQARDPSTTEEEDVKRTLLRIYAARGNSPYDMAMWLLHQRELEDRRLIHLLPDEEQGSIEEGSL